MNSLKMNGISSAEKGRTYIPLYITDLDDSVSEDFLYAFYSQFGSLHSVKILKDYNTGKSRGTAFINMFDHQQAENAIQQTQYTKFGNKFIRVMLKRDSESLDPDANLFVHNIDTTLTPKEVHEHFSQAGKVVSVKLQTDPEGRALGYGFVQFQLAQDANNAINVLHSKPLRSHKLFVLKYNTQQSQVETVATKLFITYLPSIARKKLESKVNELFTNMGLAKLDLISNSQNQRLDAIILHFYNNKATQEVYKKIRNDPFLLDKNQRVFVTWYLFGEKLVVSQSSPSTRSPKPESYKVPLELAAKSLRSRMREFLNLDQTKQQQILGELLYSLIEKKCSRESAPIITGMLIDLDNLEPSEVVDMIEDQNLLEERIEEANKILVECGRL